jgi:hypothetical protein
MCEIRERVVKTDAFERQCRASLLVDSVLAVIKIGGDCQVNRAFSRLVRFRTPVTGRVSKADRLDR